MLLIPVAFEARKQRCPAFCGTSKQFPARCLFDVPSWGYRENIEFPFEILSESVEADLDRCLGETAPSHATQALTSLRGSEHLLDPTSGLMNDIIPCFQPGERFFLFASPHRCRRDAERPAL
ncbi:hypothetical protein HLH33_18615 [Gluconacetobacter diazotrophicus]|uniref:Uncharacterized protein n=1 Tax=Gluconacetobacter diazotrophicus TaxID=33996 RepID=A0A7W4NN60_GLUDI|nr:hypothetical protein [Gluconacetobacter diazotrophicus]MBB2158278.1 hypothetical protein [Gluconacetobacter diazotrophicus]